MFRHLSLVHATSAGDWRGRLTAVNHVCSVARQIMHTQYHSCDSIVRSRESTCERKESRLTRPIRATPSGRLMFQIIGAMAEFERSLIQERVLDGLLRTRSIAFDA